MVLQGKSYRLTVSGPSQSFADAPASASSGSIHSQVSGFPRTVSFRWQAMIRAVCVARVLASGRSGTGYWLRPAARVLAHWDFFDAALKLVWGCFGC